MLKAELAELKAKAAQPQPAAPAPQQPSELDSIKGMLGQLAGAVQSLAARVEERESAPPESTQLGGLPPQPQLNILDIVRAMKEMQPAPVAPVAPVQQPMGMLEMMKMITDMKSVFQPQNINVDTSPLEDRIEELQKRLDAATKDKPSELTNLVAGIKAIREVTGLMDGKLPEKPQGFMGVLSGIVERIAENPAPLAEAAERVFTAARGGAAAQPVAPSIPEDVRSSMEAMLRAQTSEQVLVATHTWLTAMGNHQEMQGIVTRISNLLQSGKAVQLNLVIKEVFKKFGYEKYATTEKVSAIVSHVLAQVQAANAEKQAKEAQKLAAAAEAEEDADDEDDDEGEEDEEPKSPDMTVTVGGASAAGPDDVEPEEEPEEPEHEEAEDAPPEMEVAPEPEPEEEPAPEPKKKRKSRKKKSTPAEVAE